MMYINFPDTINSSRKIIEFKIEKKGMTYSLSAKFNESIILYNHKKNVNEHYSEVKIVARGLSKFFKFYTYPQCEVFVMAMNDDSILTIGILVTRE